MTTTRLKEAGWADVIDSAVILFGPHDTHQYEYEVFVAAAQEALAEVGGNVVTLGPMLKNNTHYMGVDTTACRETLINRGWIVINDRRFRVRSVDDTRFVARIPWCPPYIPGSAIAAALGDKSVVTNVEYEMYKWKGLENISTGIRLVSMVGDRHTVPHLIQVTNPLNKQTYEMLVTVVGRAPLCLKCRRTGHYRRDCTTPYCRHHGIYGHSTEQCTLEKVSYANAAKKNMANATADVADSGQDRGAAAADKPPAPKPAKRTRPGNRSEPSPPAAPTPPPPPPPGK